MRASRKTIRGKNCSRLLTPIERAVVASKVGFPLTETDLSGVIIEAVASRPSPEQRAAISLVLYLALRSSKRIAATAAETLAGQLSRVLQPLQTTHMVYGKQLQRCREVALLCSTLDNAPRDTFARNLLTSFLPDGYQEISPQQLHTEFVTLWDRFELTNVDERNGS